MNQNYHIVDIAGLAEILKTSPHTLKKNWRNLPHFFIGEGRNLKGARFDVQEVIAHLKKESGFVSLEKQKNRKVDRKVQVSKKAIQAGGVQNKIISIGMGSVQKGRAQTVDESKRDPFDLCRGINSIS